MPLIAYLVIDTKRLFLLAKTGNLGRWTRELHNARLIRSPDEAQEMIDVIVRQGAAKEKNLEILKLEITE